MLSKSVYRGITSKLYIQELWFLCSACRPMILKICMKFQEDTFNGFQVKHRHNFVTELLLTKVKGMYGWVSVSRPFNSISVISRWWKGEHERLCAMKHRLGSGRISPPAGFEPKGQRGITKKKLHRFMVLNTCKKFYEHILKGFKVIEQTWFCHRNCYLQSSNGWNSESINIRVMVLALCMSSNVG